ncbi:MAG TPA: GPP34 family phosphoprotein [Microlunatus sp.]
MPRLHLGSTEPLGHPVLDFGLQRLAQKKDGTRLDTLVTWSKLDPQEQVVASLVDAGVLTLGSKTMLGLGRSNTPEIDPAPEGRLRARLAEVLLGRAAPTVADASLLSILVGLGVAQHLLSAESGGLKGRRLKQRVVELSAQTAAGSAVGRAVDGMNAALMTAVIVPAAVAGSG